MNQQKNTTLILILILLLVVAAYFLGHKSNSSPSDESFIRNQQELLLKQQDSLKQLNKQQDQFYVQQLDSLSNLILQTAHTKTLSQQQINTLKHTLQQQKEAREAYIKNMNK